MEKAVQANQLENIKQLLAAGANVEWKNGGVFSPLTTALRERHADIVHFLLDEAGADPNAPGEHLPLVKAIRRCQEGDFSMIELLLDKGADPNKCYRDWNPIMQAIENRDLRLLSLLIEKGGRVDLAQKDETGQSVLDMADSSGWLQGSQLLLENSERS
jgi:FOG: Ankyrin repeat